MHPLTAEELTQHRVPGDDLVDPRQRCLHQREQPHRFVERSVLHEQRLQRQTNLEVTPCTLRHADARHDVVHCLVPRGEDVGGDRGEVVLHVDPMGDHHGRRKDCLEGRTVRVDLRVVGVQEGAAPEIGARSHARVVRR